MKPKKTKKNLPRVRLKEKRGTGTIELLGKIKAGSIEPKEVSVDDRRQIVSYLMADGLSTAEIARILSVSDRTIERDRSAIREANTLEYDSKLAGRTAGRILEEAELSVQRIRRVVRDKDAPHAVKVDGHHKCFQILAEMTRVLQGMGYLPTASQGLRIDGTCRIEEPPSFEQIGLIAMKLHASRGQDCPENDEISRQLETLAEWADRFAGSEQLNGLARKITGQEDADV